MVIFTLPFLGNNASLKSSERCFEFFLESLNKFFYFDWSKKHSGASFFLLEN